MTVSMDNARPFTADPPDLNPLEQETALSLGVLTDRAQELVDVAFQIEPPSTARFQTPHGPATEIRLTRQLVTTPGTVIGERVRFASGSGIVRLAAVVSQNGTERFSDGTAVSLPVLASPAALAFAAAAQAAAHAAGAHAAAAKAVVKNVGGLDQIQAHAAAASAHAADAAAHATSAHEATHPRRKRGKR
jgi:hypothetical protein